LAIARIAMLPARSRLEHIRSLVGSHLAPAAVEAFQEWREGRLDCRKLFPRAAASCRLRKNLLSWIFVSADAVEISGGFRPQSASGAFMFLQGEGIL